MKVAAWVLSPVLAASLLPQGAQPYLQPAPQSKQPPTATFNVNVRLVSVFVNVSDATGAPVGGLTKDDFTLSEDGHPQKIAYFERESEMPLSIVLAIDESGSVYSDFKLEQDAAKRFVHSLVRPQDEISVLGFDEEVHELVPFTNNLKRVDEGINDLHRGAATALYNAIYLAGESLAQRPTRVPSTQKSAGGSEGPVVRRKVIVMITDGGDTVKGMHYDQAVEQALRSEAMVYSIIIVPIEADAGRNTGGEHALIQMAADTGGKYYYVNDSHDLRKSFEQVSNDLRTQYLLGYYPNTHPLERGLRSLRVTMATPGHADYRLHYRSGYYP